MQEGAACLRGSRGRAAVPPKPWTCLPCYACPQGLGS